MTANRLSVLTAAALVCLLAACGKKEDPKPADLACADPAVLQNIRDNLQQAIKGQARTFADNDIRHFVDADKVIAAASELTVSLNNPQQDNSGTRSFCQAELAVAVPAAILQTAHTNAPSSTATKPSTKSSPNASSAAASPTTTALSPKP